MSSFEEFWDHQNFAVIGHSAKKPFPTLTYEALKKAGKTVHAVDPSTPSIKGDATCSDLASLPNAVDGVVIETPKEETRHWVERAADLGIKHVWIHMGRDTPEALAVAREHGINVRSGTCAVMYLKGGYHTIHKWINKARRVY